MPKILEQTFPLRELRERLDLSGKEVAKRLATLMGEDAPSYEALMQIEKRGTQNYFVIGALAAIYGMSREEIAVTARMSK